MTEECEECGKEFDTERGLHIHQTQKHEKQKEENKNMEKNEQETEVKTNEESVEKRSSEDERVRLELNSNKEKIKLNSTQTLAISGITGLIIGMMFSIGFLSGLLVSGSGLGGSLQAVDDPGNAAAEEPNNQETASLEELEEVPYDVNFGRGTEQVEWNGQTLDLEGRPYMGSSTAEVKVVSFEDFFCPYCASLHNEDVAAKTGANSAFPQIAENHIATGEVQYYFQQLPVVGGTRPAVVSECVAEHGSSEDFWTFQYNHFKNYEELQNLQGQSPDQYDELMMNWASQLSVDEEKFQKCIDEEETRSKVNQQAQVGQSLGAQGTPAVFVGGELVEGAQSYDTYRLLINDKINSAVK
jgi:protein-disulfide isomerase